MLNKATLIGNVGRDPETRYTSSGQAVCNFSLATSETFKSRSGEKQQKTEWHNIVAWGKLAEIIQQYVKKGAQLYIEGRIETREWTDKKDGSKRKSTEINAFTMKMLGKREGAESARGAAPEHLRDEDVGAPSTDSATVASGPEITDDDIPF